MHSIRPSRPGRRLVPAAGFLLVALASSVAGAGPRETAANSTAPVHPAPAYLDVDRRLDVNDLDLWVPNNGSLAYDLTQGNAGLMFPRGSDKFAVFAAGLWVGAKVGGAPRVTTAEYSSEWAPGRIIGGGPENPSAFELRTYKVASLYFGFSSSADSGSLASAVGDPIAHEGWGTYVAQAGARGAPMGTFAWPNPNPPPATLPVTGPTLPGRIALWTVFNDADPGNHSGASGSAPLGVQVDQAVFGYGADLPGIAFVRYTIANRSGGTLDSTYFSFWCDPDLGAANDDLIGFDVERQMGYAYNGQPSDAVYGAAPPAVGVVSLNNFSPPDRSVTGFAAYPNGTDPDGATSCYRMQQGLTALGVELIDPTSGLPSRLAYTGDPVTGTGWLDSTPRDQRMLITIGPRTIRNNEVYGATFAIVAAQGTDRLQSIERLRCRAIAARAAWDNAYIPPFAAPGAGCDFPVPALLTLEDAAYEDGAVRLSWYVAGENGGPFDLARRPVGAESWSSLARVSVDGTRHVVYADRAVAPGENWEYGLFDPASPARPLDVARVAVPGGAEFAMHVVAGRGSEAPSIVFALPTRGEVRVETFDVTGRRRADVALGVLESGTHTRPLPAGAAVRPGLAFVRLTFAGQSRVARAVVLR